MSSVSFSSSSSTSSTSMSKNAEAAAAAVTTTAVEERLDNNEKSIQTPTSGEYLENFLETKKAMMELLGVDLERSGEEAEGPWESFTSLSVTGQSAPQLVVTSEEKQMPECLHVAPTQPSTEKATKVTSAAKEAAADNDAAAESALPQAHLREANISVSEQVQQNAVGVLPHRVFSKEEVKALMEQRRRRELTEQEELRLATSKGSSFGGSSTTRGSICGISTMRTSSNDVTAGRHVYSVSPSAPPPPPTGQQRGYHVSYPAASLSSSCTDFPSPPPYPHPPTAESAVAASISGRLRAPPSQPTQAVCGPWGIHSHPPYPGFSHPYSTHTPVTFDPALMLREQQQQQLNSAAASLLTMLPTPQAPQGGMMGMSMQELGVLARLIVLAQSEQQQQQQQQLYYYHQAGKHLMRGDIVNPANQPHAVQIKVNVPVPGTTMQENDVVSASDDQRECKTDLKVGPTSERQEGGARS